MTEYTNNNKFVPQAQTYEVRYLENQEQQKPKLSLAARSKVVNRSGSNYISERTTIINPSYGPCKSSLCGCSCYSDECNCKTSEFSFLKSDWRDKNEFAKLENYSVSSWEGSHSGGIQYSNSKLRLKDENTDAKFLSGTAGGEIGINGFKFKASADVANVKTHGFQARVGLNVDSGIQFAEDKVEVKAAGFGVSVGKQTGISTPFGEVKVDTEDCVIQ
jgi:hypothetical protein